MTQPTAEHVIRILLRNVTVQPSGCWEWTGPRDIHGYGKTSTSGRTVGAHRWLWTTLRGPLATDQHLDHLCRNRACVLPDHLEPVSCGENLRRGHLDRGTHICPEHGLKARRASGRLVCRPCLARAARIRRATDHPEIRCA
ncbi:HNH endonuclease [Streptomyces noursei]|uniref:HNH endonuclease n=1 Tax=Streptomyces noursei TaxID=1971 RepID=UPI0023B85D12|nr:HNH endonuclease [Streptomyces noursei]